MLIKRISALLLQRCPVCFQGKVFNSLFGTYKTCPHCGCLLYTSVAEAAPLLAAQSPPSDANGVLPFGLTRVKTDIGIAQEYETEDITTVGNWLFFRLGTELWLSLIHI